MIRKTFGLTLLLSVLLLALSPSLFAASDEENKTSFIMHHVKDSHEWHFATFGHTHVTLPLPVIIYSPDRGFEFFMSSDFQDPETHAFGVEHEGYYIDSHDKLQAVDESRSFIDLSITKNVAMMLLVVAVLLIVALSASSYYKKHPNKAPKGIASFLEPLVIFVRDEIALPNIGPKYRRFTPYLLTLFFFIWFGNLLGLMPGAANLTGNIAVTATLAVMTSFVTNLNGNKEYWKNVYASPTVPLPLLMVIVPVEIIGLFTKPFALLVRLFVALTVNHNVILRFIGLIFSFASYAV